MAQREENTDHPWSKYKTLAFLVRKEQRHDRGREPKPMRYGAISPAERRRILECLNQGDLGLNDFQENVIQRFLGREYSLVLDNLDLAMGRLRLYPPEEYPQDFDTARTLSGELLAEAGRILRLAIKHSSNLDNLFFDGVDYADVAADLDEYTFKRYVAVEFSPIREAFIQGYDSWRVARATRRPAEALRAINEMDDILADFTRHMESIYGPRTN